MAQLTEHLLATDFYKRPLTVKNKDALAVLLIRLLLMHPGTNPLHPEMGIALAERYRFCSADDIPALNGEIQEQIKQYLPNFRYVNVECEMIKSQIYVNISIDDTLFSFTTETDKTKLKPGQIVLSDAGY